MTTSGTASYNPSLLEIIQEAYDRAGITMRSGYEYRSAARSINLLMMEWANRGLNLWTVDEGTQLLTDGTATYNLPADTVDLIDHVIRTGAGNVSTQADLTINRISFSNSRQFQISLQKAGLFGFMLTGSLSPLLLSGLSLILMVLTLWFTGGCDGLRMLALPAP